MLTVTDAALQAFKQHLVQHNIKFPIRITRMGGCCKGETLRFTLCKLRKNDLMFVFDNIIFLLDRDLSAQYGPIKVDFEEGYENCPCSGRNGGFNITSERVSQACGWAGCWETCASSCQEQEDIRPAC